MTDNPTVRRAAYDALQAAKAEGLDAQRSVYDDLATRHGARVGDVLHSAQFERFAVVALSARGEILEKVEDVDERPFFDTTSVLVGVRDRLASERPGAWIECVGIFHDGSPWCLVVPLNRPSDQAMDEVLEKIAAVDVAVTPKLPTP